MSNQFDLPIGPEVFSTRAAAEERVRTLRGLGGIFEIQWQPGFQVATHPRFPEEFVPERFLVVRKA